MKNSEHKIPLKIVLFIAILVSIHCLIFGYYIYKIEKLEKDVNTLYSLQPAIEE